LNHLQFHFHLRPDRLAAVLNNKDVIRDFIAFPKNNSGKDLMIDAPAKLTKEQLKDMKKK